MLEGKVIDADGHIQEDPGLWQKYLKPEYKSRAIRLQVEKNGDEVIVIDNRPSPRLRNLGPAANSVGQDYVCKAVAAGELKFGYLDGPKAAYEPHARLGYMDEQGIDVSILFPGIGLAWESEVDDARLAAAYARAYNNWLLDFTSVDRHRLATNALISAMDIDEGAKEIKRIAKLGAKGTFMRAAPINQIPFWDRRWDPFWAALQDTGLPIGFHVATNDYFLGHQWKMEESPMAITSKLHFYRQTCIQFDVQAAFAALCLGGVFDRFPELKVLLPETGAGWIAHFLERLDDKYKHLGWKTDMKDKPSNYFRRQCWISLDPDETTIPAMVERCGADRFIWASDFPHFDASPEPVEETRKAIASLSKSDQKKILGDNAAVAYGLS
jgi:predicted TIM-barrel fold metal-dependent hydrolase